MAGRHRKQHRRRLPASAAVAIAATIPSSILAVPAASAHQVIAESSSQWAHPVVLSEAVQAVRQVYTVKPGDSLSGISGQLFGDPSLWPRFYEANKSVIGADPNTIYPGQKLQVQLASHGSTGNMSFGGSAPVVSDNTSASVPVASTDSTSSSSVPSSGAGLSGGSGVYPGGAFGQCVVSRESGGNSQVMNSTGHYGLYQFSESTWVAYGGSAADFGNASVAEQDQVFANALAAGGQSNWSAYDGC